MRTLWIPSFAKLIIMLHAEKNDLFKLYRCWKLSRLCLFTTNNRGTCFSYKFFERNVVHNSHTFALQKTSATFKSYKVQVLFFLKEKYKLIHSLVGLVNTEKVLQNYLESGNLKKLN